MIFTERNLAYYREILTIRKIISFSMERFSQSLFDFSFRILIVLLPFVTVISVFTSEKL